MEKVEKDAPTDKILQAADELFYQEGVRAVGMDDVKERAGVALRTLYRYFPSKETLVETYLRRRDERWRAWLASYVERFADPEERLLAIFDALTGWFESENYHGCAFINAAGELPDGPEGGGADARRLAGEHKRAMRCYVEGLVEEAGLEESGALTRDLMLLVEGAIVTAYVEGDLDAGRRARRVAEVLLGCEDRLTQGRVS